MYPTYRKNNLDNPEARPLIRTKNKCKGNSCSRRRGRLALFDNFSKPNFSRNFQSTWYCVLRAAVFRLPHTNQKMKVFQPYIYKNAPNQSMNARRGQ